VLRGYEAGWALDAVWACWRAAKLVIFGNLTPECVQSIGETVGQTQRRTDGRTDKVTFGYYIL
jgi:hypothetical protein